MKPATFQIVLASVDVTKLVPTGRNVMRDMNWFPEFRAEAEGKACMWMNKGSAADVAKAEAYAAKEGWKVFTYPTTERDPLGKAKAAVLR